MMLYSDSSILIKFRKLVPLCYKAKNIFPAHIKKAFYSAIIQSKITYNIDIWGSTHFTKLLNIQRVQNIIARKLMSYPKTTSGRDALGSLGALNCYALHIWIFYKMHWKYCVNSQLYPYNVVAQTTDANNRITRGCSFHQLRIPRYYTDYGRFHGRTRLPYLLNYIYKKKPMLYHEWEGNITHCSSYILKSILKDIPVSELKELF